MKIMDSGTSKFRKWVKKLRGKKRRELSYKKRIRAIWKRGKNKTKG